jgi:predicted extracellular nuclease
LKTSPGGGPQPDPTSTSDSGTATTVWGDPLTTRREGFVRLAQLNVRRYFDTKCDTNKCTGTDAFEDQVSDAEFEDRTAQLASGLAQIEADIVTLSEIETKTCLDALQAKLKEIGLDYPVAHLAEVGAPGSVDVAVLARGKLLNVKNHRSTPLMTADGKRTTFTRELPEVTLQLGETKVVVFSAHFRSKSNDEPERRLAEAVKTQELMVASGKANSNALVLLGGDLNDTPGSPPINALEEDGALVRVAKDLSPNAQGTYDFNGQLQAIDHIFATKAGYATLAEGSVKVTRDGVGLGGSDHSAISADFHIQ